MTDKPDLKDIEQAAVRLLATREHTQAELKRKLAARAEIEFIQQVLDSLVARNLQSDDRFTEQYIQLRQRKGFGPVRIRHELKEKGVNSETIDEWLDERDDAWYQALREAHMRKFGDRKSADFKEKAKFARFLEYRGFPCELIRHFLRNGE